MQGLVPVGTLVWWLSCHGTARTLSTCTVLCKVSSLSGRWSSGCLITALRGLCPLVPCYARSRPCRDAGLVVVLSRHCEDFVLLYRVLQGLVPVGTLAHRPSYHGTARTFVLLYRVLQGLVPVGTQAHRRSPHGTARTPSSCTVLCKVASLSGRIAIFYSILTLRLVDVMVPQFLQEMSCRHDFNIVEGARCDIKGYDDEAGIGMFLAKCL